MKVCVVGLGRIGLPTAALCVARGHDVVGVDDDTDVLQCIRFRDLPYEEPGIELDKLRLARSVEQADPDCDVWLVCVGTSLEDDGAVEAIVAAIAARRPTGIVVIESTVVPGTCARLAEAYGLEVVHCPERARPGEVLADIARIPRLIGGVTPTASARALAFYCTITGAEMRVCTSMESELAKIAENAEREVRIAFANELADVARGYGVDVHRVIDLANSHPRAEILRPGIGVGGHCLPMATRFFAQRVDGVSRAARALHERRPAEVAARVARDLPAGAHVCVLGRTYRPDTRYHQPVDGSDRYASPAVQLIDELRARGFRVTSWDPSDEDVTREEATAGADLVLVATPHRAL